MLAGEAELDALCVASRSREVLPILRARGVKVSRLAEATFLVANANPNVSPTLVRFPSYAPATSALSRARPADVHGARVPVFPLEWLTVCLLMRTDGVSLAHAKRVLSTRTELVADVELVFDDLAAARLQPRPWVQAHFYDVERGRRRLRQVAP